MANKKIISSNPNRLDVIKEVINVLLNIMIRVLTVYVGEQGSQEEALQIEENSYKLN